MPGTDEDSESSKERRALQHRDKLTPSLVGERQRCVALAEAAGIPVPPCPTPQMLFEIEQEALAELGVRTTCTAPSHLAAAPAAA